MCTVRLGGDTRRLKPRTLSVLLAAVGLFTLPAFAQIATTTLPRGGVVAAGSAAISQAGAAMRVDQTSNKAVIDWQSFNIGRDASVRFYQPSASSIALNRVGADGGRSIIDGRLTANGQVWLLNPGGVLFGPTARVDVGGLLASSLKLGNDDFMGGNYRFAKDGAGSVVNQGTLTAANGGYIALLAPEVRNEGVIAARLGTVALASGDEIRIDFSGDRLIEIKVDQAAVNGLIDNRNLVEAEGGWVLMSAGAAGDLAGGAINNTGMVRASSLTDREGLIRLEGGFVALGGTLSADGEKGGTIQVTSSRDLSLADSVSARGLTGAGGSVSYRAGGVIMESTASHTDVSGHTDGGTIRVVADGGILSSGTYSATGTSGQGGRIDMSGGSVRLLSATLDASGSTQGGLVRVGGAFQGGKAQDTTSDTWQRYIGRFGALSDLPSAQRTFINDSSRIDVASRVGAGGTAVVWSDAQTTFLGGIAAKGGAVEISSAGDLRYVNLAGLDLGTGFLLLDPKNIVIGDFPTAGSWTYQAILGKGYSGGKNVDVSSLETGDNFGISVSLNAAGDRLAVGAWGDDGSGNSVLGSGAVRLFSFTDTNFSGGALQATLGKGYIGGKNVDVSSLEANDDFGWSVALNAAGNLLAVGAPQDDGIANLIPLTNSGAVRLFSFTDTNFSGGTLQATIGNGYAGAKNVNVISLQASDNFGKSVALNAAGDRLAVGANGDDDPVNLTASSGAAYLFSFSDTNFSAGALQATIGKGYSGGKNVDVSSLETGDNFGISVSLNAAGDRLAVGAFRDGGSGNSVLGSGAAYLFSFTDTNFSGGALQATLGKGYSGGKNVDVSSLEANDNFGWSVALNAAGNLLAVGAHADDGSGNSTTNSGAAYLFSFSDTNFSGGALQATIGKGYTGGKNVDVSALEVNDFFGTSVALNAAGDRLAVATESDNGSGNSFPSTGAVYLFSNLPSSSVNFASNPAATENIDRAGLQALLSAGTSVTLQASNDITLNAGSDLVVNNPSGSGGQLNLQAGRSVLLNSSIVTDNTDIFIDANSRLSSGVVDAQRDAGPASIIMAPGTSIDAGSGNIFLRIIDGLGLTNSTAGNITAGALTASQVLVINPTGLAVDGNIVLLGTVTASDAFIATQAGDLTVSGALNVIGNINLWGGNGTVALQNAISAGGSLDIVSGSSINFTGPVSVGGNLAVVARGAVTQTGALVVTGTTSVNAGAGAITLTSGTNDFTGAVSLSNTGSNNVAVTDANAIVLGSSTLGGDLLVTAVGGVTLAAPVSVANKATFMLSGGGGVSQTSSAPLAANQLLAMGTGFVDLDTASSGNKVGSVAANLTGTFWINNDSTALTVSTIDGVNGVTAYNIGLRTDGNLTLNAPLVANGAGVVAVGTTTTVDTLCPGPCVRPHIELGAAGSFTNNVGAGVFTLPTGKFWSLQANMPSTTTLNGLTPDAVSYDAASINGDILLSANRVFYAAQDSAPATTTTDTTATTTAATTVSQQSSYIASTTETTPSPGATQAAGGTGSGGATMSNFTASSTTTQTPTTTVSAPPELLPMLIVDVNKLLPTLAGVLNRSDLQVMIRETHEARTQLFADALALLAKDPRAADIADCGADGGDICIATASVQEGYLPVVKRKIALLIGNNNYRSPISDLNTAINDVSVIGAELRNKMGYEVQVVQNANRKGIVDALNGLIRSTERNESVVIMYAGHGYLEESSKAGYWLPTDADATKPDNWISNDSIARALGNIPAKQVMLVSDSCYSGSLTKEGKVTETVGISREQTLTRRSVLALSSGGEEPVSDEGHDNHSIFAWNLIQSLKRMKDETPGQQLHAAIKEAVAKDFPQVPQYGTVISAGHAEGGEYLLTPKKEGTPQ